jgi:hypothetical protein
LLIDWLHISSSGQILLHHLMGDCHFNYITKLKTKPLVIGEVVGKAQVHKLYYAQRPHPRGTMVMTRQKARLS